MAELALSVRDVAKQFRIGKRQAYNTVRESFMAALTSPLRRLRGGARDGPDATIWALDGVSFDVPPGQVLGIIGRNGAGKSTLLKILARITAPTRGELLLRGRVGALLEVGTGFHPELTGRENIYLSAAVMGMKRAEIQQRFDAIVAFAEIERFLDTQVKHYSTGMYTRLAFAVAANLESDILIVDEVLAVGDAAFQRRCLNKMEDVGRQGRTVLFVSHNMPAIARLCRRVILLHEGRILMDGEPHAVATSYLGSAGSAPGSRSWPEPESAPGDAVARLKSVRVLNRQAQAVDSVDIREPFRVEVQYWNLTGAPRLTAILHFNNQEGLCLFASNDFVDREWWAQPRRVGLVTATCNIPGNFLAEGRHFLLVAVGTYNPNVVHALQADAVSILVLDNSQGDGVRGECAEEWPGVVRPMLAWQVREEPW